MMKVTRNDLYEALWTEPLSVLVQKWNTARTEIIRAAEAMQVPRPPRGHWIKIAHKTVSRPVLPEASDLQSKTIELPASQTSQLPERIQKQLEEFARASQDSANRRPSHPAVKATAIAIRATAPHGKRTLLHTNYEMSHLSCSVTKATLPRALLLLDCILHCADHLGAELVEKANSRALHMKIGEDIVEFGIREVLKRIENPRTEKEWYMPKYDHIPSGILEFHFESAYGEKGRWSWKDGKTRLLEDVVGEIVSNIPSVFSAHKRRRERIEERSRRWAEEERKRVAQQAALAEEKARREILYSQTERWHLSEKIRRFLEIAKAESDSKFGEFTAWRDWAAGVADSIDPLLAECKPWHN